LQIEYKEYFKFMLKCYDVDSPNSLSDEKKSEFFDNIKKLYDKHDFVVKHSLFNNLIVLFLTTGHHQKRSNKMLNLSKLK